MILKKVRSIDELHRLASNPQQAGFNSYLRMATTADSNLGGRGANLYDSIQSLKDFSKKLGREKVLSEIHKCITLV